MESKSDSPISTVRKCAHPFVYFPMLAAAMLVWAFSDEHEWKFYALLRWVSFGAFLCSAMCSMASETWALCVATLAGAVIFNPFFKFHFGHDAWIAIDAAAAMLLIVGSWVALNFVYRKDL